MKRAGNLYEKIIDRQNIETAIYNASKRKRNRPDVVRVLRSIDSGLPLGNYSSPIFANFYVQGLDHHIREELGAKYMVRYMDDVVIFGPNKKKLHKMRKAISAYLSSLCLTMKGNWQVFRTDSRPLDFLGYRFYRNHTTMRRRNALRIRRRVKKVHKKRELTFEDSAAVVSYLGWIYQTDSRFFFRKHVKPYINLKKMKGVIRNESRKRHYANAPICN